MGVLNRHAVSRVALLVAVAAVVHLTHRWGAALEREQDKDTDQVIFIPDGKALRYFALGQQTTLADLYWLKLIQYLGGVEGAQPKILGLANLVTDLDPEYSYAYMASGLVLAAKKRLVESNEILEKGAANAPWRWEIPFYLGFNYWYELGDWEKGAYWLKRAVQIPGRPPYLPVLVPRLLATAGDVDAVIVFVKAMAE
jgi:tetratricopeptide (TPR) repeat protein